jgi:hypothetical protein
MNSISAGYDFLPLGQLDWIKGVLLFEGIAKADIGEKTVAG